VGGPLVGLRVVELGVVIAAPSTAALLGDWGADVVKVEPREGDPQRANVSAALFDLDNRGKRSLTVDLTTVGGQEIARRLLDRADVFVTNLRPSALSRLGLDAGSLLARNPRLVYGTITGYGTQGPGADKAGYDLGAFWARAGVVAALVGPGNEPPICRPGLGDHTTGLTLTAGILAALLERERTGRGQVVETSLLRAGAHLVSSDLAVRLGGGEPKLGLRRSQHNPLMACYQAGDGRWFFLLGLQAGRHWPSVARAIGRPELIEDERFSTFKQLLANHAAVMEILDEAFATRPLAEWADVFAREDVWWDPVQDLDELLADELFLASGALRPRADGGTTMAPPVHLADTVLGPAEPAPEVGQHTEQVLLELGYDWDGITALREAGAI
jgi:crotonobetainyl-CoA:carnitine CoA-transferase CaiB-like acyl-CoA transferase